MYLNTGTFCFPRKALGEKRPRRAAMLSDILWPSGVNIGATNNPVQELMSYYVESIQLPDSHNDKVSNSHLITEESVLGDIDKVRLYRTIPSTMSQTAKFQMGSYPLFPRCKHQRTVSLLQSLSVNALESCAKR